MIYWSILLFELQFGHHWVLLQALQLILTTLSEDLFEWKRLLIYLVVIVNVICIVSASIGDILSILLQFYLHVCPSYALLLAKLLGFSDLRVAFSILRWCIINKVGC